MLLNIATFILTVLLVGSPPGLAWLVFKDQREPEWCTKWRKPLMITILGLMATIIISLGIVLYEITQIQERLNDDIREIQSTMQQQ
jgi:hypothetical protein